MDRARRSGAGRFGGGVGRAGCAADFGVTGSVGTQTNGEASCGGDDCDRWGGEGFGELKRPVGPENRGLRLYFSKTSQTLYRPGSPWARILPGSTIQRRPLIGSFSIPARRLLTRADRRFSDTAPGGRSTAIPAPVEGGKRNTSA